MEELTLGELKKRKFRMRVSHKVYDVYPDFQSLAGVEQAESADAIMAKASDLGTSITIVRKIILQDYYAELVTALKKEAGSTKKLTKAQLEKAYKKAIESYSKKQKS